MKICLLSLKKTMRAIAFSVWMFLNLVFIGMCGYLYLLWSHYWYYADRQNKMETFVKVKENRNQIIYYNVGKDKQNEFGDVNAQKSYDSAGNVIYKKSHHPRIHYSKNTKSKTEKDSGCKDDCAKAQVLTPELISFKNQLLVQLRRTLLDEGSVFKVKSEADNPYNVQFSGARRVSKSSAQELMCELKKKVHVRTLLNDDPPFNEASVGKLFPKYSIFHSESGENHYNSCAIITNAASLFGSELGKFIDSHDFVLRFNHAPTSGYEIDVGAKTTMRILNSQVVSKPEFEFLSSEMYRNVMLLAWDPCGYSDTLKQWYENPDFDLFSPYSTYMKKNPGSLFYILDPRCLWSLWDFIQRNTPVRIRKNPPSSGFLGLTLLLPHCRFVDLVEYVPSVRLTNQCHYWEEEEDSSCTFGVWHPLAAEKLISLDLNTASEYEVYSKGFIRIPGFSHVSC